MSILLLTLWAVVGAAAGTADFYYESVTPRARGVLFAKDFQIFSEVADISIGILKMLKGGTTNFN